VISSDTNGKVPRGAAIVVLGPGGAALGRRVRDLLPGAELFGPVARADGWDRGYDRLVPLLRELFAAGRPIVGLCASGILIRAVAPLLANKQAEPPVIALAEDGSVAVPLLGGHHGANALARALAEAIGGTAAITTAGDLRLGFALDEPPPGWRIANPDRVKPVAAALLAGERVALIEEAAIADWLRAGAVTWAETGARKIVVTERRPRPECDALVFHPPVLALGIGCERGVAVEEVAALAHDTLAEAGLASGAVAAIVSIDLKVDEQAIHELARALDIPARFFPASRLLAETGRLTIRSEAAYRATGCWGVAEGAALAAVGADGVLVVPRRQSRRATCAIARAAVPIDASGIGRPRGRLAIVGTGPGDPAWRTPETAALLAAADEVVGYRLYLDLLGGAIAGKRRHDGAIGEEAARVRLALDRAAEGRSVALVSSGDPGVYGLAALVFELIERERRRDWSAIDIAVAPGISAMHAAAARVGAPLGHDFCAISLSDLLTPWAAIRARLEAAASADFVVALYNPRSARRTGHLAEAADLLLCHRSPATPCVIARNLGRPGETTEIVPLHRLAEADSVDMLSIVLVGGSRTRLVPGAKPWLYTPRGYFDGCVEGLAP
jgi:cobalt-precorrin 5A hydrolase / precorrin-3B C17-methyltransferase